MIDKLAEIAGIIFFAVFGVLLLIGGVCAAYALIRTTFFS